MVVFNVLEEIVKESLYYVKSLPKRRPKLTVLDYIHANGDVSRPLEDFRTLLIPLNKPSKRFRNIIGLDASSTSVSTYGIEIATASGVIYWGESFYYPRISMREFPIPFISYLGDNDTLPGVTNTYIKLGIKYRDDPALPEGALEHDVRISMETYLMNECLKLFKNAYVLVDGPIYYPIYHSEGGRNRWNDELAHLNSERVQMFKELTSRGIVPIAIVKRIETSKYLPSNLFGEDLDVNIINRNLVKLTPPYRPLRLPFFTYEKARLGPDRVFTYLAIPKSIIKGSYGIYRIELLKETFESVSKKTLNELIEFLAFNSMNNKYLIPLKLLEADRISKALIKMQRNYIIKRFEFYGASIPYEIRGEY